MRISVFNEGMSHSARPRLVSIGYEGRDINELIRYLRQESVDVLVDVRLNPISRKPGLSKRRLAESLASAGIDYVHMRELGNPKDNREGFRAGDRLARDRFWQLLRTEEATQALRHVTELLDNEVVALLCFEGEHSDCHRGLVAEALVKEMPQLSVSTR
jgi:uncharacterized protein (DUF488 family)